MEVWICPVCRKLIEKGERYVTVEGKAYHIRCRKEYARKEMINALRKIVGAADEEINRMYRTPTYIPVTPTLNAIIKSHLDKLATYYDELCRL